MKRIAPRTKAILAVARAFRAMSLTIKSLPNKIFAAKRPMRPIPPPPFFLARPVKLKQFDKFLVLLKHDNVSDNVLNYSENKIIHDMQQQSFKYLFI